MLTYSFLKSLSADTHIATGITHDERLWKDPVRWVAIKGEAPDWAIYYHLIEHSEDFVAEQGDKILSLQTVQDLVPCDKETLEAYRKY